MRSFQLVLQVSIVLAASIVMAGLSGGVASAQTKSLDISPGSMAPPGGFGGGTPLMSPQDNSAAPNGSDEDGSGLMDNGPSPPPMDNEPAPPPNGPSSGNPPDDKSAPGKSESKPQQ